MSDNRIIDNNAEINEKQTTFAENVCADVWSPSAGAKQTQTARENLNRSTAEPLGFPAISFVDTNISGSARSSTSSEATRESIAAAAQRENPWFKSADRGRADDKADDAESNSASSGRQQRKPLDRGGTASPVADGNDKPISANNRNDQSTQPSEVDLKLHRNLSESRDLHGRDSAEAARDLFILSAHLRTTGRSLQGAELLKDLLDIQQRRNYSPEERAATCGFIAAALREAGHGKEASCWTARSKAILNPSKEEEGHKLNLAQAEKRGPAETERELLTYSGYLRGQGRHLEGAELLERRLSSEQRRNASPVEQAATCDYIAASLRDGGRTREAARWTATAQEIRNPKKHK